MASKTNSKSYIEYSDLVAMVKANVTAFRPQILTVQDAKGEKGFVILVHSATDTWALRIKHFPRIRVMRKMDVVARILTDCGFNEASIELEALDLIDV